MIRRRVGDRFWLIRQTDHARLAGELAGRVGNSHFAPPPRAELFVSAVTHHDDGWPFHDDAPARSPGGFPLDVFEMPRHLAHRIWSESARRACEIGPYVGLLVSLHQLALSAWVASANTPQRFDAQQLRQQFDTNKFQHAMIELTETLRGGLGLRTDRPLKLGLAEGWTEPAEETLAYHLRMLQALDMMSLAICCEHPPTTQTGPAFYRPGGGTTAFKLHRSGDERQTTLLVRPWPFESKSIELRVPYRSVEARPYGSDAELDAALAAAPHGDFAAELRPA